MIEEMTYPCGTRVLMWRLDEDAPLLLALCREAGIKVNDVTNMPPKRQREKAAERLLLRHAMGKAITLRHTSQGAPIVEGMNVSISHTPKMVALACNAQQPIGIDAEHIDRHQVLRVRDKFLNPNEKSFIADDDLQGHILAWTAKEAIIKLTGNSAIDWTNGILLDPFETDIDLDNGTAMTAQCDGSVVRLLARLRDGHIITLANWSTELKSSTRQ